MPEPDAPASVLRILYFILSLSCNSNKPVCYYYRSGRCRHINFGNRIGRRRRSRCTMHWYRKLSKTKRLEWWSTRVCVWEMVWVVGLSGWWFFLMYESVWVSVCPMIYERLWWDDVLGGMLSVLFKFVPCTSISVLVVFGLSTRLVDLSYEKSVDQGVPIIIIIIHYIIIIWLIRQLSWITHQTRWEPSSIPMPSEYKSPVYKRVESNKQVWNGIYV